MKQFVSGILFALLLTGMFTGAFNIQERSINASTARSNPSSIDSVSSGLVPVVSTFTTVMNSNTTTWDTDSIYSPFVFYDSDGGLYKMWYTALSERTYWSPYWVLRWVIAYAESRDGVVWVNKTIVHDTGSPSYYHTDDPWVLIENGTYRMWHKDYYEWIAGDWSSYIARMSSSDGVSWPEFMSADDVKVLSALGQWDPQGDGNSVQDPCVIYEPGVGYTMWYSVWDHYGFSTYGPSKIWRATSSDGVVWSGRQLSLPYISGTWEANIDHSSVVREEDGTYTMFYGAQYTNGSTSIGMAESLDGVTWTNRTQLLKPSDLNASITSISTPFHFQDVDGKRYLYFTYSDGKAKFGRVQLSSGPMPKIIIPDEDASIIEDTEIFATDQVNVMTITSATFEYSYGGSQWELIGTDTNGTMEILSENCTAFDIGLWNVTWFIDGLAEGLCYVRVTMVDVYGRTGQDVVSVFVDPTPPTPIIIGLADGASVNGLVSFDVTTTDEKVNATVAEEILVPMPKRPPPPDPTPFKVGVPLLNQHKYGPLATDDEGSTFWNNNHYCALTAAASVIKYWAEHGFPDLLIDPSTKKQIPLETLINVLAKVTDTREFPQSNPGTNLLRLKWAMETWIKSHGGGLTVDMMWLNFENFKKELESGEMVITGTGRHALVGNSLNNKKNADGTNNVDFMDPWTGSIVQTVMYPNGTFYYWPDWWPKNVLGKERMLAISPKPKPPAPGLPPVPQRPKDGPQWKSIPFHRYGDHVWTFLWNTSLVEPNEYYLVRVSMLDTNGRSSWYIIWVFVQGEGLPDVAIVDLSASKQSVTVVIENQSNSTETTTVTVTYRYFVDPLIGTYTITLAGGATTSLVFTWTPMFSGAYEITAEASLVPYETDATDNTLKITIYVEPSSFEYCRRHIFPL